MIHFMDRREGPYTKKNLTRINLALCMTIYRKSLNFFQEAGHRLTVDETMIQFKGRSHGITTILGKLIPTRFKYFILVEDGYIIDFKCTAPRILEGESNEDITSRVISILEKGIFTKLSNTQAVVKRFISYST